MTDQSIHLIRGVRVDGDRVIVQTKDNDAARVVCGALIALHVPQQAERAKAPRVCRSGTENVCLPCFLNHGECVAPVALPAFDGVEESAAIALQGEAVATKLAAVRAELNGLRAGGLDRLRAKSEADDKTMTLLRAEIAGLRARIAQGPTPLPQIDPEMIPADCALPAFDGVEEAQMAVDVTRQVLKSGGCSNGRDDYPRIVIDARYV